MTEQDLISLAQDASSYIGTAIGILTAVVVGLRRGRKAIKAAIKEFRNG